MANESMILQAQRLPRCLNPYHQPHKDSSMRFLLIFVILTLICFSICAQPAQPDRWRGLIVSETTPEQAVSIFGHPKEMKPKKIYIQKIGDWLSKDIKRELPHMRWEDVAGMKSVDVYFLNGKLVAIELLIKAEVRAAALESIYGVAFKHLISNAGRIFAGNGAYQRDRGETYSNKDEVAYHVGAKAERAFLVAWCEVGFGEGIKREYGAGTDDSRPGRVRLLQIYSRILENRDGVEVLSSEPAPSPLQPTVPPPQSKPAPVPESKKTCFENGRKVPCP